MKNNTISKSNPHFYNDSYINRYSQLYNLHRKYFSEKGLSLFSSPGRIEIIGNHTDHNNGKVVAASINLDSIAAVSKNSDMIIRIYSIEFGKMFVVELNTLKKLLREMGTTEALIRGISSRFNQLGFIVGGFDAIISSNVMVGSGLSSSAALEVLIGKILSVFYNDDKLTSIELAMIGQYAENIYFGKPCGLMDQIACAYGGLISIDFKDSSLPIVKRLDESCITNDYTFVLVDTGGTHADLTEDYASVPNEMKLIANHFSKQTLREISVSDFYRGLNELSRLGNDRAILRSIHYFSENKRVDLLKDALTKGDIDKFMEAINSSGSSSFKCLQNVYTPKKPKSQKLSLALALSNEFVAENGGAHRIHGGGFAGTILVIVKNKCADDYCKVIDNVFGDGSAKEIRIRNHGVCAVS